MVDSVLHVVNELLGTVLGKLGSHPLLFAPSPILLPLPQWVGVPGEEERAECWDLSLPPQTDEATTLRRPNGGGLG